MSVKVHIHKTHRQFTGGLEVVEAEGTTVGECLKDLVRQHPGMEPNLFTKKGTLSPIVEIYLNAQSAYPNELAREVRDGDEIYVTFMLAGG